MTERPIKPTLRITRVASAARSPSAELARWARQTFTRENFKSALASMIWVIPLTVLIWVYGAQNSMSDQPLSVNLSLASSDPKQVLTPSEANRSVQLTLHGAEAAIQQVVQTLSEPGSSGLVVPINETLQAGSVELNSVEQLNQAPLFKNNGVTVLSCNPSTLQVIVDEMQEREVPVVAPNDPTLNLNSATFDPPTVKISGPARELESPTGSRLAVTVDVAALGPLRPGLHTADVSVVPPSAALKVSPTTVKATLNVREEDEHFTLLSVPVWPCEPNILGKDHLQYSPMTLNNVQVFGPPEKILQLKGDQPAFTPIAWFRVTREDVGRPNTPKQLKFDLPDGVHVSDADAQQTVDVKVTEEQPAGGD
jgi:YbbR-like protein